MDGTTSGPGDSGAGGGSAPAGAVDVPAAQQNVTQVVITTGTLWRGVGVVFATVAGLWAVNQARGLTSMLVISLFFALALVPGVNHLHEKRGWRRGAAVGFIGLQLGEGISGRVAERRQAEAVRVVLESDVYTSVPGFDAR